MIIGKQGTHIKWMKRNSRCSIEVNREAETVTIVGQPADVEIAKRLVAETLEKAQRRTPGEHSNKQTSGDEEMAPAPPELTAEEAEAGELSA